jgi:predicted permease
MATLLQDLRYGMRVLIGAPGFSLVAILTLALGIGANAAMFSIVNGVLLRPLPFPHPERLVVMHSSSPQFPDMASSYPNFLDWESRATSFELLSAFRSNNVNVTGQGEPERLRVGFASASFFDLLGLEPVVGRAFTPSEDRRGAAPVVVLAEPYWKERFGGDPGVIGRAVVLDGVAHTVVGVAAADLVFERGVRAFIPIGATRDDLFWDRGVSMGMVVLGRLRPGTSLEQARTEMTAIARALALQYPKENKEKGIAVQRLREAIVAGIRPALLMLLGAVAFVLLIACANVANLLLARSAARRREFAIRSAIGAGSRRLARQVVTEGALLAAAGGATGLAFAHVLAGVVGHWAGGALPAHTVVTIDARVVIFTAAVSLATAVAFAAVPAWHTARADLTTPLREGGRGASGRRRTQRALVVAEIALALVLTTAAGLMVRTLWQLWQVDPGFDPRGVLTFALAGSPAVDQTPQAIRESYAALNQRIRSIPGVEASSIALGSVPMASDSEVPFSVVGQPPPPEQAHPWSLIYMVSADYRRAFGLTLLRGRFITPEDTETAPSVVVIDEELARAAFGAKDPLGERLHLDVIDTDYEVVGVVGHVRHWGLDGDAAARVRLQMYLSFRQLPDSVMPVVATQSAWVVRSHLAQGVLAEQIKRTVNDFSPTMTVFNVRTMEEIIHGSLAERRLARLLLGSFAGLALLLAAVGIYGVMSQLVLQSTHELGVRIAVGASPGAVLTMVLASAARMALAGIAVGAVLSLGVAQLLGGLLYGVTASDPITLAGVAAVLGAVTLAASLVPAWRATTVDPMVVLRCE